MAAAVLSLDAAALSIVATVVGGIHPESRSSSGTAALLLAVSGGMNLQ